MNAGLNLIVRLLIFLSVIANTETFEGGVQNKEIICPMGKSVQAEATYFCFCQGCLLSYLFVIIARLERVIISIQSLPRRRLTSWSQKIEV